MERNIQLYPIYAGLLNAYFWMPVFFLYFNSYFPLEDVLLLEAVYYAAIVILEVPTGYFSDVVGRRVTLIVANTALVGAYVLFFFSTTYYSFVIAQIGLAAGLAFNSGTDTSIHYESLAALGRESEFDDREAKVARNTFSAGAFAAVAGGVAGIFGLRYAYGLSALCTLVSVGIVLAMKEPPCDRARESGFVRQVMDCVHVLRDRRLFWLVSFFVFMIVLNHVPYEFYQPYVAIQGEVWNLPSTSVPVVLGIMTAIPMVIAGSIASRSIRIRDCFGLARTLLAACGLQAMIIATMAFLLHPIVLALILLRSCPRALMTAPHNAAIAPAIPQRMRATFFSLQSLAGRLAFSGFLIVLATIVGNLSGTDSEGVFQSLQIASAVALGGLLLLAVTSGAVSKQSRQ